MNWGSAAEFFSMGGNWLYVWGSYLVSLLCIAGEVFLLKRRRARARLQLTAPGGFES